MIFLDTSFLVSVEVKTDQNHEKATKIMNKIIEGDFGEPIISDYIFDETITVTFGRTKDLGKSVSVGENLRDSTKMIKMDEQSFENAWEIFKSQEYTRFSFTDCTTVSIIKKEDIANIATFDDDFRKVKGINVVS